MSAHSSLVHRASKLSAHSPEQVKITQSSDTGYSPKKEIDSPGKSSVLMKHEYVPDKIL